MYTRCVYTCNAGEDSAGDTRKLTYRYRPRQQPCFKALKVTPLSVTAFSSCSSDLPVSEVAFLNQCHCTRRSAAFRISNGSEVLAVKLKKGKVWGEIIPVIFVVSLCVRVCLLVLWDTCFEVPLATEDFL